MSEDSAQDGVNWNAYCNGNPVNAIDNTGKVSIGVAALRWNALGCRPIRESRLAICSNTSGGFKGVALLGPCALIGLATADGLHTGT